MNILRRGPVLASLISLFIIANIISALKIKKHKQGYAFDSSQIQSIFGSKVANINPGSGSKSSKSSETPTQSPTQTATQTQSNPPSQKPTPSSNAYAVMNSSSNANLSSNDISTSKGALNFFNGIQANGLFL